MGLLEKFTNAMRAGSKPAPDTSLGRNDPCWCGSGDKYKRCHLESDRRRLQSQSRTCGTTG